MMFKSNELVYNVDEDMETTQQLGPPLQGSTFSNDRLWSFLVAGPIQKIKSLLVPKVEGIVEGANGEKTVGVEKTVPVILDSVSFNGGTLMLLAYGDNEPRLISLLFDDNLYYDIIVFMRFF